MCVLVRISRNLCCSRRMLPHAPGSHCALPTTRQIHEPPILRTPGPTHLPCCPPRAICDNPCPSVVVTTPVNHVPVFPYYPMVPRLQSLMRSSTSLPSRTPPPAPTALITPVIFANTSASLYFCRTAYVFRPDHQPLTRHTPATRPSSRTPPSRLRRRSLSAVCCWFFV